MFCSHSVTLGKVKLRRRKCQNNEKCYINFLNRKVGGAQSSLFFAVVVTVQLEWDKIKSTDSVPSILKKIGGYTF